MAGLTEKQKRFVDEYLVDLNATAAARRAGYKDPNKGRQVTKSYAVAAAIQEGMKNREKRTNLTQDYVINNLVEIVERCMQRAPVCNMKGEQVLDEEGNALWTFNDRGANKALELLGKHLGLFRDKVEMDVALSPASILETIRQRRT